MKPLYRHIDAALLRASAHRDDLRSGSWPEPEHEFDPEQWLRWLDSAWSQPSVANSIVVASPALASRIDSVLSGRRLSAGEVRRLALSLARYLVRMRGRATPFGLFAGVAPLHFEQRTAVRWTDVHHTRTRADGQWLAAVTARLEACPALFRRLTVAMNSLATVRGERLVVSTAPSIEVSVRHSRPMRTIAGAARSPVRVTSLIDTLIAEYPDATSADFEAMVTTLVVNGVLITSLRPPTTTTDSLGHLLQQLADADVDTATMLDVGSTIAQLHAVHSLFEVADAETASITGPVRRAVTTRMRALTDAVEQPLMVDLRLGCQICLPSSVAAEAASAAGALARLSPHPTGTPAWREYHDRFLDRYGPGAVVPITLLADPTTGLGFPGHYHQPPQPTAGLSTRDERLLVLAQQAVVDGAHEVVLDDDAISSVSVDGVAVRRAPHVDLCVEVRAANRTALDAGVFTLVVTGTGATAVATVGRFLDVLPDTDRQDMTDLFRRLPVSVDGAVAAQLSFPSIGSHAQNVLRSPRVLPHVISLAEHGARIDLRVDDLAVTADHERMYVVSLSRRLVVEPTVTNAAARHTMPALARLLFEIPRGTNAGVSPFDWGSARCLPFRPRIRYGRTILSPARWLISPGRLPGPVAPQREWTAAVAGLRERLRLPSTVYVGTADRRLRLHLTDALDLTLLRDHLNRASNPVTVMEAPTAADHGWLAGRAHEVVIPLVSTASPVQGPTVVTSSADLPVVDAVAGVLPGSSVLFAKLYAPPDLFDVILTRHLPDLLSRWGEPPLWWFVRYRTPHPHLRLRLHHLADYGEAANRVGQWASRLRQRGLLGDMTLDTYRPETARYGSGPAMAGAEELFAADSAAVVAELAARAESRDLPVHALTAVSMVDLACAVLGGRPAAMRWLIDRPELTRRAPGSDCHDLRQAVRLAELHTGTPSLAGIPNRPLIVSTWAERRRAADQYAGRLGTSHVTPSTSLVSLLHMYYVRAHGINPEAEAAAHRLARAVALAWNARHNTKAEKR